MWLDPRFGGAGDNQNLVDVGHQDMLPAAARSSQHAAPRFDPFDNPIARRIDTKRNPIPRDDDMPLIGAERFEQSAGGALMQRAIVGLHGACQPMNGKHSAAATHRFIDGRLN